MVLTPLRVSMLIDAPHLPIRVDVDRAWHGRQSEEASLVFDPCGRRVTLHPWRDEYGRLWTGGQLSWS